MMREVQKVILKINKFDYPESYQTCPTFTIFHSPGFKCKDENTKNVSLETLPS